MPDVLNNFYGVLFSSFSLISLAEFGDKSQLVCMTLAARYRSWPVFLGASSAFVLLNIMAITFGVVLALWIPKDLLLLCIGLLFVVFGYFSLRSADENEDLSKQKRASGNIFIITFLLIIVAEFGDKTQITVAGLASAYLPLAVWFGATIALIATSALGIWAGKLMIRFISVEMIHKISGILFICIGIVSLINLI